MILYLQYTKKIQSLFAIISCIRGHNHYDQGELACLLMLKGYPGCPAPGVVEQQLVTILK